MKTHSIAGAGGVKLNVVEAGNPRGRPILYMHGFSQCWLVWSRQLNSSLAHDYRLVAMDLRGHGQSDKPLDGYDDTRIWASDVDAIITTLGLDQPVLCGWSYGPLLILDYVRHFGEDRIGGIHFVDALTKLGSPEAVAVITPEALGLMPGLFSTDLKESVRSLDAFLPLLFARQSTIEELYLMLGYNISVPPYVRQALFSRKVDNDDIMAKIRKPVLITHGALDAVMKPLAAHQHKESIPHSELHMMENAGHASFRDDPESFNGRQREFCESLGKQ